MVHLGVSEVGILEWLVNKKHNINTFIHTHTHIYIYTYLFVCSFPFYRFYTRNQPQHTTDRPPCLLRCRRPKNQIVEARG